MYRCFKQFGHIAINELANLLFNESYSYGGTPIHERLTERTFLSRVVTHAEPGTFSERAFNNFPSSAERVCSRVFSSYPKAEGKLQVVELFAGDACEDMAAALRAYGLNDILYCNVIGKLYQMELSSVADKAMLLILMTIATGCLGNPERAAEITQEHTMRILSSGFRTAAAHESDVADVVGALDTSARLGLCRIVGGKLRLPAYPLADDGNDTEIGLLATDAGAINDVEDTVSRRHLRIFRDEQGRWFAQGLGSTNGTTVIRGDTKLEEPIELPAKQRTGRDASQPVRIYPSDVLCLAGSTKFMVLELA